MTTEQTEQAAPQNGQSESGRPLEGSPLEGFRHINPELPLWSPGAAGELCRGLVLGVRDDGLGPKFAMVRLTAPLEGHTVGALLAVQLTSSIASLAQLEATFAAAPPGACMSAYEIILEPVQQHARKGWRYKLHARRLTAPTPALQGVDAPPPFAHVAAK